MSDGGAGRPVNLALAGLATAAVVLVAALAFRSVSLPLMLASIGGSAVIVFGMPDSRMARPRSLFGGHAVGIAAGFVAVMLGRSDYAVAAAVALALVVMLMTDTVHSPAGADPIIVAANGAGPEFLLIAAALLALTHVMGLGVTRLSRRRNEWQR
ncbi:HPP family protein [Phreatobacter sp.]|uniref:HPP family protein n=1 Tax=Phreatobacter sp. TaxID=1966341 RepID=UPI003F73062F